jgi:hypothetical protein
VADGNEAAGVMARDAAGPIHRILTRPARRCHQIVEPVAQRLDVGRLLTGHTADADTNELGPRGEPHLRTTSTALMLPTGAAIPADGAGADVGSMPSHPLAHLRGSSQ